MNWRLGKLAAVYMRKTLLFSRYIARLPKAPSRCAWSPAVKMRAVMMNDKLGCCTISAKAHMIQTWTANEGPKEVVVLDREIVKAYSALTGYDPKTGANDNGAAMLDSLNFFRKTGIGGRKCHAFASVARNNRAHVQAASFIFGGVDCGILLPRSAQKQTGEGKIWTVNKLGPIGSGRPNSWGGHDCSIVDYDENGPVVDTWGFLQRMTWGFFRTYCDEAFGVLSHDWITDGTCPSGFNGQQLEDDLKNL
jgi:hypothetical protein